MYELHNFHNGQIETIHTRKKNNSISVGLGFLDVRYKKSFTKKLNKIQTFFLWNDVCLLYFQIRNNNI